MEDSLYRISVKGLVKDERGNYLLIRTKGEGGKKWEFPGGGMDHGETSKEALKRELNEELGVDAAVISSNPIYVSSDLTKHGKRAGMWRFWLVYGVEVDTDQIVISDSVDALDWAFIDISNLHKTDIDPTEYKLFCELQSIKL